MGVDNNLFMHIIHVHDSNEGKVRLRMLFKPIYQVFFAHKGGSVLIVSDNDAEFKNKVLNEAMKHVVNWELKGFSPIHFIHREMQEWRMENVHIF